MDKIYLKYDLRTKPILADRDGEAVVNWANGGTHSITADATHVYSGTKSFKLHSSNAGDFTTNYISLASGNNSTFGVGSSYVISIHLYATAALQIFIKTGGVTSASLVCSANAWVTRFFPFTALTATTAFQIACPTSGDNDIWFELEPVYQGASIDVLIEKGLTTPEDFAFYPPIFNKYLDGTSDTQYKSFIRNANLKTNSLTSDQLKTHLYWAMNLLGDSVLDYDIYGIQEVGLIFPSPPTIEVKRYNNIRLTPYLELRLSEGIARTTFPV